MERRRGFFNCKPHPFPTQVSLGGGTGAATINTGEDDTTKKVSMSADVEENPVASQTKKAFQRMFSRTGGCLEADTEEDACTAVLNQVYCDACEGEERLLEAVGAVLDSVYAKSVVRNEFFV